MQDLITVVIPSFNGEKYIKETIESIKSQNMPVEIIVIDDVSCDSTAKIARSMGCFVYVNEKRKGQVAGKNKGIKLSKGNYWLTIDQDDKLAPGALKRLYDEFQKDKNVKIIMAKLKDFCSPDTPEQIRFCKKEPFWGILTGSTMFKKDILDMIGDFREDIITGDVIDLTNRLKKFGFEIKKIDFVSCERRIHDLNYGRTNQKDEYKDYIKVLRERIKINSDMDKEKQDNLKTVAAVRERERVTSLLDFIFEIKEAA